MQLKGPPSVLESCPAYRSSNNGCLLTWGEGQSSTVSVTRLIGPDVAEASARGLGWRTASLPQPSCSEEALVSRFWRTEVESWAKSLATWLDPREVQAGELVGLSGPLRASVSLWPVPFLFFLDPVDYQQTKGCSSQSKGRMEMGYV